MKKTINFAIVFLVFVNTGFANPGNWNAQWITFSNKNVNAWNASYESSLKEYGVYKFRKDFNETSIPASFIIHVSGDNRYKVYVNEKLVSTGPARGDLYFWNFETIDIAKYLQEGKNTIAALVWNDGKQKPEAQISYLSAFILQGNSSAEEIVNTNNTWKAIKDTSYTPVPVSVPGYYVAGPGELVNMNFHTSKWQQNSYDDTNWPFAKSIGAGVTKISARDSRGWMLVPSPIPQMEQKVHRFSSLINQGGLNVSKEFPAAKSSLTIPSNTQTTLLFDQSYLTNAYPTLIFSKGRDAGISISYAEALYEPGNRKGNRNLTEGKIFIGKKDSIISNGSSLQEFTSLWWRTYRYVQLIISTKDEPLVIDDIYGTFTGYPFERKSTFSSGDSMDNKILDIGWRTARLCAFETYMDCPYYEQLQYIGDARIQALVTMYNTSDDRLVKNALTLMDHSRIAEGITLSRYPTDLHQQITTFSLWYIAMLHDFWMYRPDTQFVKDKLPGTRQILSFFRHYQQADGSLKNLPYWKFTDWLDNKSWDYGEAPKGKQGFSSVLDLQLLWIYRQAAEMEAVLGYKEISSEYLKLAAQLKQTVQKRYWDNGRQLYADTEDKDLFSQHANSLAILAGMVSGNQAKLLATKILKDPALAPASIYFKYYLHQALVKSGLGDDYKLWLGKWKENIDSGMTTWAEMSDVGGTRSDCHAWGSSPNIEYFRTILGIDSDAPGFKTIKITPHPSSLDNVSGAMPHPNGTIKASYKKRPGKWQISISLPPQTSGSLVWRGKSIPLKAGLNQLEL